MIRKKLYNSMKSSEIINKAWNLSEKLLFSEEMFIMDLEQTKPH